MVSQKVEIYMQNYTHDPNFTDVLPETESHGHFCPKCNLRYASKIMQKVISTRNEVKDQSRPESKLKFTCKTIHMVQISDAMPKTERSQQIKVMVTQVEVEMFSNYVGRSKGKIH